MDRWVCLRCYTANDGWRGTCVKCGLLRGSQPPAENPTAGTAWSAATPVAPPRRQGNLLIGILIAILVRFWWVVLVAVIGIGGAIFAAHRDTSGKITQGGSLAISELAIGDCFDRKDPNADKAEEVNARPCDEKHQFELMAIATMAEGSYPTESQFEEFVAANCIPAFGAFVGTDYEQSHLDIYWYFPLEEGWGKGDHLIQCAVYDPLNSQLSGSLRGAKR